MLRYYTAICGINYNTCTDRLAEFLINVGGVLVLSLG